jgi:flagellar protein FlbD
VIILTRLGGLEMAVNPDLIERAEPTPDTVITMIDGHKLVVAESLDEVVERVRRWRASVAAEAFTLAHGAAPDAVPAGHAGAADAVGGGSPALAQVLRMPAREV